ncbi:peptide chain release factor family protein [Marinobacter sp. F3R08]|uniref:peptide chain release factor family protein n=1 Tax=Marinobacter sp. F3R08 TaxID=2841559 RepID=UPI001C09EAC7|nr:peptide chain release factor-like protein [Marinobacter sp. F3R08]MBU2952197.1 hypothetical protein [Marinobacter sp. F3R08]
MSKVTGNMQIQTPEGVAVTTTPATGTNDDIDSLRYEVSARTLQIDMIRPNKENESLGPKTGVRIRHIPTGLIVEQTKDRAQFRNRDRALTILRERLAQLQQTEAGER